MSDVTQILNRIEAGDPAAAEQLLPLVYQDLRRLAAANLAQENPGQTFQATALVHEAYLRLTFGAATEAMRRILVDSSRRKQAERRGGSRQRLELMDAVAPEALSPLDLLALDEALERLNQQHPQHAAL